MRSTAPEVSNTWWDTWQRILNIVRAIRESHFSWFEEPAFAFICSIVWGCVMLCSPFLFLWTMNSQGGGRRTHSVSSVFLVFLDRAAECGVFSWVILKTHQAQVCVKIVPWRLEIRIRVVPLNPNNKTKQNSFKISKKRTIIKQAD